MTPERKAELRRQETAHIRELLKDNERLEAERDEARYRVRELETWREGNLSTVPTLIAERDRARLAEAEMNLVLESTEYKLTNARAQVEGLMRWLRDRAAVFDAATRYYRDHYPGGVPEGALWDRVWDVLCDKFDGRPGDPGPGDVAAVLRALGINNE